MKTIEINLDSCLDISEFKKVVGFVSEDIKSFTVEDKILYIDIIDTGNENDIKEEIMHLMTKFISTNQIENVIFSNICEKNYVSHQEFNELHYFDEGMVALGGKALFLYRFFERKFKNFAFEAEKKNCKEKMYPVLLPLNSYKKTGYLKNSPQYSMFCCSTCENLHLLEQMDNIVNTEDINNILRTPQYSLSPSACFHTYIEFENQVLPQNQVITFTQSVFRNEGRFNFGDFGRLRDYHVREIVVIGDSEYVATVRKAILDMAVEFIKELDLVGNVSVASDPFIIPKMQKYKKIQMIEESKYEMRLNYNIDKQVSVASFNLHGTAFTYPFNIRVDGCEDTVTGCVGFGLERWVMAFLGQYGDNIKDWPDHVKQEYCNGNIK